MDLCGIFGHDTTHNCTNWKSWKFVWNTINKEKVPCLDLICPAQNEVRWISLASSAKEPQVPKKVEKF